MLAVSGKQAKGIEMPKCGKPTQPAKQDYFYHNIILKKSQKIVDLGKHP